MDKAIVDQSFEQAQENVSDFVEWDYSKVSDLQTSGNYSSNQTIFETTTLSNNGKITDYKNGFFTIPVVDVVTGENGGNPVDFTAAHIKESDLLLCRKNSSLNMIDSVSIQYQNQWGVQETRNINQYLIFKQHEQMSLDDEYVNGPTIGYAKDTSDSWSYDEVNGLMNNNNAINHLNGIDYINKCNKGMYERQQVFNKVVDTLNESKRNLVLGNNEKIKEMNRGYVVNTATYKAYYHNAIIRLKDLSSIFEKSPPMKGGLFKITVNFNQCIFKVTKTDNDTMSFSPADFNGRGTNPLMVCSSGYQTLFGGANNSAISDDVYCGGYTIPDGTVLTISSNIAKPQFYPHNTLNVMPCKEQNCFLHIPSYIMKPALQKRYLESPQKQVIYNDTVLFQLFNKTGQINELITNGISYAKRMIICPFISSGANGTNQIHPFQSPFTCEPGTCSPYVINNFQVKVSSTNLYPNQINYSYDMFMRELNGKYGVNFNLTTGLCSSRINLKDFINTYGYIVVDLKRKHTDDESVPLSIQLECNITSPKPLDFNIFIEQEKSFGIEVATGKRVD